MSEFSFGGRIIAQGSTLVTAVGTVDTAAFVRVAGERIIPLAFVSDTVAGLRWSWGFSAVDINVACIRTANANEFMLRFLNNTGVDRTVEWAILAVKSS